MGKSIELQPISVTEAKVLNYLRTGCAGIVAKSATRIFLQRQNKAPLETDSQSLAELARKGWVKREGKTLSISETALNLPSAPLASDLRETVIHQLFEGGAVRQVTKVVVESPIDYLVSHKDKDGVTFLSQCQWSAGDRLRSDFTRANMLPGIGMRWGEPIRSTGGGAGGGVTQTDAAMAARLRVNKALAPVGPEFSGLLLDVCCYLKGLSQVEAERGWPQRSAKLMVRAGLSILERHYSPPATPKRKLRVWGTDDYRPML